MVANAGAVSTGAVDPLAAIAELCEREQLWFHVDGSLGGVGILDERRRDLFHGLEGADSLVLDPHKWLSVPVDCAAVLVRDLDGLRDTFSLVPPYLRRAAGEDPWYSEYVYDQTRPFRALERWATLAGVGRDGIASRITRNIDHALRLADQIVASDDLELVAEPTLNVVAFRHTGGDDVNRAIPGLIQAAGDIYLRGTVVHGAEALRACFMHHATTSDDVDRIVPRCSAPPTSWRATEQWQRSANRNLGACGPSLPAGRAEPCGLPPERAGVVARCAWRLPRSAHCIPH